MFSLCNDVTLGSCSCKMLCSVGVKKAKCEQQAKSIGAALKSVTYKLGMMKRIYHKESVSRQSGRSVTEICSQ